MFRFLRGLNNQPRGISPSLIAGIQDRHDLQAALFRVDQCFRDRFSCKRVRLHVHGLLRVTQLVHDGIRAVIKINSIPQLIPLAEISYFL